MHCFTEPHPHGQSTKTVPWAEDTRQWFSNCETCTAGGTLAYSASPFCQHSCSWEICYFCFSNTFKHFLLWTLFITYFRQKRVQFRSLFCLFLFFFLTWFGLYWFSSKPGGIWKLKYLMRQYLENNWKILHLVLIGVKSLRTSDVRHFKLCHWKCKIFLSLLIFIQLLSLEHVPGLFSHSFCHLQRRLVLSSMYLIDFLK